jgi:hypothetical protein
MKIEVQRSGGFAGITTTFSVDEKSFTLDESHQLEELLNKARFFDMLSKSASREHGADYYIYHITIENEGRKNTVKATDIEMSQGLRELINFIMNIQKRPLYK